ncbi:MAG: 16S rRNA (guanine(527)-N(7))-methyltransferase RsmG [Vicinamibacteraceae bacterium]
MAKDADDWRKRIVRRAHRANLDPLPEQVAAHAEYLSLLSVWNARMNLTALTDRDEAVDRLILEPVSAARLLPGATSLLDVGSGGGSPAIPLKVQLPHASLCMVESKIRKGAFLREAVRKLGLANVRVESRRFEELLTDASIHECCDVVTIRAVRVQLSTLVATQAFLKPGGRLALFRGPGEEPLPAVPTLTLESDEPLVESLRSRLVTLRKSSSR